MEDALVSAAADELVEEEDDDEDGEDSDEDMCEDEDDDVVVVNSDEIRKSRGAITLRCTDLKKKVDTCIALFQGKTEIRNPTKSGLG